LSEAAAWLNNYLAGLLVTGPPRQPPLHVAVFGPGPPGGSRTTQVGGQTIIEIVSTGAEQTSNTDSPWTTTRDTDTSAGASLITTGDTAAIEASKGGLNQSIQRAIFLFDLSEIPAGKTITAATLALTLNDGPGVTAIAQTCPTIVWPALADYLSASGSGSDTVTLAAGSNVFALSAAALAEIEAKIGGSVYVMLREQAHDHANSEPAPLDGFLATVLTELTSVPAQRPLLTVTYE
jgi:hypothetical protein